MDILIKYRLIEEGKGGIAFFLISIFEAWRTDRRTKSWAVLKLFFKPFFVFLNTEHLDDRGVAASKL